MLLISIAMSVGVHLIRGIFLEYCGVQRDLELQLDELRHFQHATVGRELRMKELVEENTEFKRQLAKRDQ